MKTDGVAEFQTQSSRSGLFYIFKQV
uniref:Uncharacterized protein n=1 Tax=Anguilla anguilla TaxID=7936 RepID=A0A0E9UTN6_ANGAN